MPHHEPTGTQTRTAVVTGAASERSIGRATATRFARDGWSVAVLDLDGDGAIALARELGERFGVPTAGYGVDITDSAAVNEVAAQIAGSELPTVGALSNIAGVPSPVSFLDVDDALWDTIIAVNLTGTFYVTRAFLPAMIEGGYGRVVNMSSVSAQQGGGVFSKTPYSAAKAGVLGLTRSLAREMAPEGITVNAIAPGAADTNIRGDTTEESEAALSASIPMGRQATAAEIGALVVWLSGEDAGYITGTTQAINGGAYIS
ncbi:short-chain dehydrogenase [Brachybacterium sp. P6-10-X1]|uniref:SDR family NAD(P)-dependent oxidoreductase n=1 Tax=Brachybacterium sp. P6-10-X1 TaxID=1903186 RepID=UPI000971921C|nr:SDR family NAD(P)-dependent oxidoreductase [Brachybacterium sp. P6-10-X1]APX33311.1 short-chain dehydrogenase [Brachybacterium sp. P6-10-X1]